MSMKLVGCWVFSAALLFGSSACSGGKDKDDADGGGRADTGADEDGSGPDEDGGFPGGGDGGGDDPDGGGDDGGSTEDPCALESCGAGQRCEDGSGTAECIDNECEDLSCDDMEECAPAPGGGNLCKSIACSSDVQCSDARHCDGEKCVDDVCEAETQRCDGNQVFQCASNGGEDLARFSCSGNAYFSSACDEAASGGAGCTCQDDWDCPNFTECNAGTCQGTGVAPTCTLPALPFQDVLPTLEFRWGGDSNSSRNATGRPFPNYAQVSATPVVANLDDDNGDGLINELDFPEIVFMAYAGSDSGIHHSGAVRALHGGGPNRGQDYFALCGAKHWFEGQDVASATCGVDEGITRPAGGLAVGDLDYDGVPEIVLPTEAGTLQILDNRGQVISTSSKLFIAQGDPAPNAESWKYPQVGLANLDNAGLVEVILGNHVFTLVKTPAGALQVQDLFVGPPSVSGEQPSQGAQDDSGGQERHFGPTACPANLIDSDPNDQDVSQEIVAGTVVYALPTPPTGVTRRADCPGPDTSDFCQGRLRIVWDARVKNGTAGATGVPNREGYCAVADVLGTNNMIAPGPSNQLDRVPEVILVSSGRLLILRASDGLLLRKIDVQPGERGGAPNVDDFDGDGFPEIAMASSGFYTVLDLQDPEATACPAWPTNLGISTPAPGTNPARNPGGACTSNAQCSAGSVCNTTIGACVCLHNGWRRVTEDDSSKATSSSVFDFNGDGAAEVVYGDECYFRAYDGASGNVRLAIPSVSRTVLENPVVADVDNDGNAEIVFVNNNETLQCGQTTLTNPDGTTVARNALPNGIQVWGDASDTWVSARRIWNEHAYHVTNITESGHVPVREPESWRPYGNRLYNTYRSQPRAFGVAPDLSLTAIQVSSPGVACGELSDQLEIVVLVKNLGDLRVGPGVKLTYYGDFGAGLTALEADGGGALESILTTSLEPGASVLVSVPFKASNNSENTLPERIVARIDEGDAERECREGNNSIEQDVSAGEQLADLRLEIGAADGPCDATKIAVTVHNDGSLPASDVLVRLYAGDPSSGGQPLGELVIEGPILPGESADADVEAMPIERSIVVWGVADPLDAVTECNNANNVDEGPTVFCGSILL
jgi:hypothetical protein